MAEKKKAEKKEKDGNALQAVAEAVGAAVGKVAALVGDKPKTPPKSVKIPKLAKKNKSRVPRKQKKAQQKTSQAAARK
jgi:hypothetical protein